MPQLSSGYVRRNILGCAGGGLWIYFPLSMGIYWVGSFRVTQRSHVRLSSKLASLNLQISAIEKQYISVIQHLFKLLNFFLHLHLLQLLVLALFRKIFINLFQLLLVFFQLRIQISVFLSGRRSHFDY